MSNEYKVQIKPEFQIYRNNGNDWACYSVELLNSNPQIDKQLIKYDQYNDRAVITIVGVLPSLMIGQKYEAIITERNSSKYGLSYQVLSIFQKEMKSEDEELTFLRIFVTDKQYKNITAVYKKPITALLNNEFDSSKIYNFSKASYEKLKNNINKNIKYKDALISLGRYGITAFIIKQVVECYHSSEEAIKAVSNNPYTLYHIVPSIGFQRADQIAKLMGIAQDSPQRVGAALQYAIETNQNEGSTWMSIDELKVQAEQILGFQFADEKQIDNLIKNNSFIWSDGKRVALLHTMQNEQEVANEINRLLQTSSGKLMEDEKLEQIVKDTEKSLGITYSYEQRKLFDAVNHSGFVVLSGPAGTGKSFSLKCVLRVLQYAGINYTLASPTGKSAKVISNYTNHKAETIHRLIGIDHKTGGWLHHKNNPLPEQFVIIDEFSMVDLSLAKALLNSLKDGCRLLILGDPYQLPSISCGNVLLDIIKSGVVPHIELTQVFRQALESGILNAATKIRIGDDFVKHQPDCFQLGKDNDLTFWETTKDNVIPHVLTLYRQLLSKYTLDDILVLSPMRKGSGGVYNLNKELQKNFNPASDDKQELQCKSVVFRIGDKVIHVHNDYELRHCDEKFHPIGSTGVFNGTMGRIVKINKVKDEDNNDDYAIYVKFEDGVIACYNSKTVDELEHAYAITCHKSQGSQAKIVIVILNTQSYIMATRPLLYTSVTRAVDRCYLLCDKNMVSMAINKNIVKEKKTFLQEMLKNSFKYIDN